MIKAYNIHYTCRVNMYEPPYTNKQLYLTYLVIFWLKPIPILQLTQSLCDNVPFYLYIHDQGLQQTFTTLPCRVNVYEPPYINKQLYLTYSVTFFWLKRIPIHQPTQSLCFNIPFHLYIHDQGLQQTFKHSLHLLVG